MTQDPISRFAWDVNRSEPVDSDCADFYARVLAAGRAAVFREGEWRLCEVTGWPGNDGYRSLIAWSWSGERPMLVVVNLSSARAEGRCECHGPNSVVGPGGWRRCLLRKPIDVMARSWWRRGFTWSCRFRVPLVQGRMRRLIRQPVWMSIRLCRLRSSAGSRADDPEEIRDGREDSR